MQTVCHESINNALMKDLKTIVYEYLIDTTVDGHRIFSELQDVYHSKSDIVQWHTFLDSVIEHGRTEDIDKFIDLTSKLEPCYCYDDDEYFGYSTQCNCYQARIVYDALLKSKGNFDFSITGKYNYNFDQFIREDIVDLMYSYGEKKIEELDQRIVKLATDVPQTFTEHLRNVWEEPREEYFQIWCDDPSVNPYDIRSWAWQDMYYVYLDMGIPEFIIHIIDSTINEY